MKNKEKEKKKKMKHREKRIKKLMKETDWGREEAEKWVIYAESVDMKALKEKINS